MTIGVELAIVVALILLNAFFAMSELAIISARRARLRLLSEQDDEGVQIILKISEDPSAFLSIVQVGVTLNSIFTGAFSGATLADELGVYLNEIPALAPNGNAVAFALTVAGVTYLNLVIGELVPKRLGIAYAEIIAIKVARFMNGFAKVAAPIVWFLKASTNCVLWLLRLKAATSHAVTEDEVKDIIAEGTESGALKPGEKKLLEGVMRLADRAVRSIMTPRMDMVWLNVDDAPREHKQTIKGSGYSRFPVARGDMEEILGVVHAKDLLNASFDEPTLSIKTAMRPALVVPETTPVLRLLDQFKQSGQHIAIVVDEYGSVEGLVSVTDIIESITGVLPERGRDMLARPTRRADGSWLIDGMTPIDEVEAVTGLKHMRGGGDFETLAGFVIDHLRRIPTTGDMLHWQDVRFEVVDMDGRRVDKVIISIASDEDEQAPDGG